MAGAITFNVLMAAVPMLLFVAGLAGFVLSSRFGWSSPELVGVILSYFPQIGGEVDLTEVVGRLMDQLIEERTGFTILGGVVLLWLSTRLVATLRFVLREVFDLERDRGVFKGKLFDLYVVLVGGILLLVNVGVTLASRMIGARGFGLDVASRTAEWLQSAAGQLVAFVSAWVLFYLVYRYVPARSIPFRTAAVGATFTTVVYEILKGGFTWYATSVADYSNAYGSLAVAAITFIWVYYSAVVFILGGHAARVYEERRRKRMIPLHPTGGTAAEGGSTGVGSTGVGSTLLLLLSLVALPFGLHAQSLAPFGGNGQNPGFLNTGEGVVLASSTLERNLSLDHPLVETDGPYVVVHVAENRVLVIDGTEVVWSAPAGTGHGYALEGQGREWTFSTPVGMFRVLRKEKDPVWITPDWWYVQQALPIPPPSQRAEVAGTLGTSALFLGDGIAIHGTDHPELLIDFIDPDDRRVSHGCIRLTNEAARELFHRVEVGTPVLIY
ncbi:MAG: YhjD/YihY/BrkB family envelope integrity protein [Gemmatimonadota bacterium]